MTLPVGGIAGFLELQGAAAFEQGILGAQRSLSLTGESAVTAAAAVDKVDVALARTSGASSSAASGSAKLRAAQLSAVAATERYNTVLTDENASLARLAASEASMIRANERLTASTPVGALRATTVAADEQTTAFGRAQVGMAGFAESAAKLGLVFGGFEIAKKAFEFVAAGKELTDSLNAVQAASRATDEQMVAVRAEAIALGKDLTIPAATAIDAADAVLELVKAGIALPRAILAARPALLLASATNSNMADTAKVLGDTMDIFSIKGQGAAHAANIIGSSVLGASHDLLGFFDEMKQAGPSAQAMKINLDDLSTTLVYLAKHGLSMSMGGAAVKTFLTNLTKDAPKATDALKDLGVEAFDAQGRFVGFPKVFDQLHAAYVRFGPDSKRFLGDLNAAFGVRSQSAAALFGKTTGAALDEIHKKLEAGDLQKFADTMNRGVGAEMRQFGKEATAAGIDLYQKFEKPVAGVVTVLAALLPAALHTAGDALAPFVAGWHAVEGVLGPVAHGLGDVLGFLSPVLPVVKYLGTDLLTLWLAFKGYNIAVLAFHTLADLFAGVQAKAAGGLASIREFGTGTAGSMSLSAATVRMGSAEMQAEFDKIALSALESAAAVDRTAAIDAVAYADMVASSKAASDAQVAAAERAAAAAGLQARESALAATAIAESAAASAAAVDEAGTEAAIGWTGVLGPLAAVGIGIGLLVSMFHKSSSASGEATAAAKAYTDALSGDNGGPGTIIDTITTQLKDSKLPETLNALNRALGQTAYTGNQFVTAIEQGGKPLEQLQQRLEGVVKAGTSLELYGSGKAVSLVQRMTPAAQAAATALEHLNTQRDALFSKQKEEIASFKLLGTVAAPIQQVADKLHLTSDEVTRYAGMLGLAATKTGDLVNATHANQQAILGIADAYAHATQAEQGLLDADKTFSTSAATSADRAALIGATLKAANGDALGFAGALAGTTSAVDGLTGAFVQQRQTLAQQSQDQAKAARSSEAAAERVRAAQARLNQVRNDSKSSAATVRSAEASLVSAQNAAADAAVTAGKAGALAYADTERAALKFRNTQDGLKAHIDTTAKGAGDLVSQLQAMQSAAMAAASAEFQHEGATKKAADDAYNIYISKTKASLIDSRKELGLTRAQAKALADQYFGMNGKKVKTLIEAEGTDKLTTVLTKIGKLLANITGQDWNVKVNVDYHTKGSLSSLPFDGNPTTPKHHRVAGGPVSAGVPYVVGEQRAEVFVPNVNGRIVPSVGAAQQQMGNGGQQKGTHIDKFVFAPTINYPEPERASVSLPREMRSAAAQLDGFGR